MELPEWLVKQFRHQEHTHLQEYVGRHFVEQWGAIEFSACVNRIFGNSNDSADLPSLAQALIPNFAGV